MVALISREAKDSASYKEYRNSTIGESCYDPDAKQCWFCLNNKVSDKCCNCLNETTIFEDSDGVFGSYKPAWEYGTWDDRIKPQDWTPEDQERYLEHLASISK